MAKLPSAVQRQVEAAEALMAQHTPSVEAAEPEAQPQPTEPVQEAEQTQPTAVQAAETPAPEQRTQDDVWERKYKTLQGLFNAEVPKLQRQNQEMSAKLQDAIQRVEKLAEAKQAPPEASAVDPRDADTFGADLVEMVQRQVRSVIGTMAGKMDEVVGKFEVRLGQVEQALNGTNETVAVTAEGLFYSALAESVPDWEQINAEDGWLEWLSEVDPVYGQPRQTALTAAQNSLDAKRVSAVFKAYKATKSKPVEAPKTTSPLEKQLAPRSATTVPPVSGAKPIVAQQDILDFYRSVQRGEFRGREAEVQAAEQTINEAIAEGRVR